MRTAAALAAFALMLQPAPAAKLQPHTVEEFNAYIRATENRLDKRVAGGNFLWVDDSPDRLKLVRSGQVAIAPVVGQGVKELGDGLVHDWVGAIFIPNATLDQVLAAVQNYNNHKNTHKPDVLDSKLLSRKGDDFKIFLRVSKSKAGVSAVLDTEHEARYWQLDATRWRSRSYSTRIAQVKDVGEPSEHELPPGNDSGFLWRLDSYWQFEQRDGGVYVECEAVSLTRDVPAIISWLITPIIRGLPRESLQNTLVATRNAVLAHAH